MSTIQFKAFITQKDGDFITCQDRFSENMSKGRFAVADGVSNSYHPEITAQALCDLYSNSDAPDTDWQTDFHSRYHAMINERWNREVREYESTLTGRQYRHAMYKREDLPPGASTFVGISFNYETQSFIYHILGDSTLFVVYENEPIQCICTSPKEISDGITRVKYGIHPDCILADGQMIGNWLSGELAIKKGFVAIMTDGIAEWLQEALSYNSSALHTLWEMKDHEEFESFVHNCRKIQKMDDDIAIVILKIGDRWDGGFEPIHIDKLPTPTAYISNKENMPTPTDMVTPPITERADRSLESTYDTHLPDETVNEKYEIDQELPNDVPNLMADENQEETRDISSTDGSLVVLEMTDTLEGNAYSSDNERTTEPSSEGGMACIDPSSVSSNSEDSDIDNCLEETDPVCSEEDRDIILRPNSHKNLFKKFTEWLGQISTK